MHDIDQILQGKPALFHGKEDDERRWRAALLSGGHGIVVIDGEVGEVDLLTVLVIKEAKLESTEDDRLRRVNEEKCLELETPRRLRHQNTLHQMLGR